MSQQWRSAATSGHVLPFWSSDLYFVPLHNFRVSGRRQVTAVGCGCNNVWKWEQASSHRDFGLPGETPIKKNPFVSKQLQVERSTPKVVTPSCKSLWKRNWPRLGGQQRRASRKRAQLVLGPWDKTEQDGGAGQCGRSRDCERVTMQRVQGGGKQQGLACGVLLAKLRVWILSQP